MCVYFQSFISIVYRRRSTIFVELWNIGTKWIRLHPRCHLLELMVSPCHRNACKLHCSLTPTHNTHTHTRPATHKMHTYLSQTKPITLNTSLTTESGWIVSIRCHSDGYWWTSEFYTPLKFHLIFSSSCLSFFPLQKSQFCFNQLIFLISMVYGFCHWLHGASFLYITNS